MDDGGNHSPRSPPQRPGKVEVLTTTSHPKVDPPGAGQRSVHATDVSASAIQAAQSRGSAEPRADSHYTSVRRSNRLLCSGSGFVRRPCESAKRVTIIGPTAASLAARPKPSMATNTIAGRARGRQPTGASPAPSHSCTPVHPFQGQCRRRRGSRWRRNRRPRTLSVSGPRSGQLQDPSRG